MTDDHRPHTSPQLVATIELPDGPIPLWLSTANWQAEAAKWKATARKHEATIDLLRRHLRHLNHNTSGADRRRTSTTTDTPGQGHTR